MESILQIDHHQSKDHEAAVDDDDYADDQLLLLQSDGLLHWKCQLPQDYLDLDKQSHDDLSVPRILLQVTMLFHCATADEATVFDDADVSDFGDDIPVDIHAKVE